MAAFSDLTIGRLVIVLAVFLQAVGKVMYGTWLPQVPSPLFVLFSFALTAAFFLSMSCRGVGDAAWGPLLLLNASTSTALTFLSFFFALKMIEPAIVGAVEIGVGPILAVVLALLMSGERPTLARTFVCCGVLGGCMVLTAAALQGSGFGSSELEAWLGPAASVAAGTGAVLITVISKILASRNWAFGAILAHRFYLIVPISLFLSARADLSALEWNMRLLPVNRRPILTPYRRRRLTPLSAPQAGPMRCSLHTAQPDRASDVLGLRLGS